MGLRRHVIFFDKNPNRTEVEEDLNKITGLKLLYEEIGQGEVGPLCLTIRHPIRKKEFVDLDWIDNDPLVSVGTNERGNCIRVESNTGQIKNNYVEVSLIYLLKKKGGMIEPEYDLELPEWAGKKWVEVYKSPFSLFLSWFKG
jgi:hypothetical protein